jgi:hypothetical protein
MNVYELIYRDHDGNFAWRDTLESECSEKEVLEIVHELHRQDEMIDPDLIEIYKAAA